MPENSQIVDDQVLERLANSAENLIDVNKLRSYRGTPVLGYLTKQGFLQSLTRDAQTGDITASYVTIGKNGEKMLTHAPVQNLQQLSFTNAIELPPLKPGAEDALKSHFTLKANQLSETIHAISPGQVHPFPDMPGGKAGGSGMSRLGSVSNSLMDIGKKGLISLSSAGAKILRGIKYLGPVVIGGATVMTVAETEMLISEVEAAEHNGFLKEGATEAYRKSVATSHMAEIPDPTIVAVEANTQQNFEIWAKEFGAYGDLKETMRPGAVSTMVNIHDQHRLTPEQLARQTPEALKDIELNIMKTSFLPKTVVIKGKEIPLKTALQQDFEKVASVVAKGDPETMEDMAYLKDIATAQDQVAVAQEFSKKNLVVAETDIPSVVSHTNSPKLIM